MLCKMHKPLADWLREIIHLSHDLKNDRCVQTSFFSKNVVVCQFFPVSIDYANLNALEL